MTLMIRARNVNHALSEAIWLLRTSGVQETSRNGPVLVAPGPVITEYSDPQARVLFEPRRDCNHVFHLMEAIWMLAGQDDVRWLLQFNSKFDQFAEPDSTMHGAYGHRWRKHFGLDQILQACITLKRTPDTRQVVIGMWSPSADLVGNWKDRPCNTHIYFDRRGDKLNMMVNCRSNDILWGAYGSNVVHFSMLQELIAQDLGIPIGTYWQNSFNFHMYTSLPLASELLLTPPTAENYDFYNFPYESADRPDGLGVASIVDMLNGVETIEDFLYDCRAMIMNGDRYKTFFMQHVARPLMVAYLARRAGKSYDLYAVQNCDWKMAFEQWCDRRDNK